MVLLLTEINRSTIFMNTNDIKTIELVVNSEQAKQKLNELNAQLDKTKQKRQEALEKGDEKAFNKYSREAKKLEHEVGKVETRAQGLARTLRNLDKASPNDLRKTIRELNQHLNSGAVERNSKEWKKLTDAVRAANQELAKIKAEQKAAEELAGPKTNRLDKIFNAGNKMLGVMAAATGLTMVVNEVKNMGRAYVEAYAQMEEAESGVIKYTGMTREEVKELNDEFKRMDTRTSREQLNALAADAGRLGIQSKKGVKEFVEAADMINVALGEDLGEDAVKNIGKLAQLFGDEKTMGLKQAMLASASTINELAQTSSASEPYIMDFTARLAGVGMQAHMTQAQIMSYGAVLDTSMVAQEKGATALQNVLTALYRKPAEMAKVAGLDVKKFTQTLKEDGNAALLQFIEALNKAGNMDVLAPMLDEMKLSGSGVTQTLSALANNIDNVRQTQIQATAAFLDAKSVQEEYDKANNTVQAGLDKAKNRFKDMTIELGEKLLPVMANFTSMGASVVKMSVAMIRYTAEHKATVTGLCVTFGIWITYLLRAAIAAKAVAAWEGILAVKGAIVNGLLAARRAIVLASIGVWKLVQMAYFAATAQTYALEMAQRRLNAVMRMNPWGLVASLIATAVTAIMMFTSATKNSSNAVDVFARKQRALDAAKEKSAQSTAKERASLEVLLRIVEDGNRSYTERKKALDALNAAIPEYHGKLSKSGQLERANRKAVMDYIAALEDKATAEALYDQLVEAKKKRLDAERVHNAKQNNVNKVNKELQKSQYDSRIVTRETSHGQFGFTTASWQEEGNQLRVKKLAELKIQTEARTEAQKKLNDALATENAILAQAKDPKYRKHFENAANKSLTEESDSGGGSTHELEKERKKRESEERKRQKEERERLKQSKKGIEQIASEERAAKLLAYTQGRIDHEAYQEALFDIEATRQSSLRDLYDANSEEWAKHEENRLENEKKRIERHHAWSMAELSRMEKEETHELDMARAKNLMTEEQYEQALNELKLCYLHARAKMAREEGQVDKAEELERQIIDESNRQKLAQERTFQKNLDQLRKDYIGNVQLQYDTELKMLENLKSKQLITEEEYMRMMAAIRAKYEGVDGGKTTGELGKSREEAKNKALEMAGHNRPRDYKGTDASTDFGISGIGVAAEEINRARESQARLKELYRQGEISHQQYTDACEALDKERFERFQQLAGAAFSSVGAIMNAASNLFSAQKTAETARIEAEYDRQIQAAGYNSTRVRQIEEKKSAEVAKIKSKYAKREAAMQIAQALAQTAMNALNAAGAVYKIPIIGPALAVAAAAAATAAGMMQVAAIRKQAEAQEKGYYEGGFTGGTNPRKRAGIVHEGEFVANHLAVQNPNVRPLLNLLDHAQRTNTIGTLTAADVSRAISPVALSISSMAGSTPAPAVQVVRTESPETTATLRELKETLDRGIVATVTIDGPDGLHRQYTRYQQLNKRK